MRALMFVAGIAGALVSSCSGGSGNAGAIAGFWSWLTDHQQQLDALVDTEDPFWDEVLNQLGRIDEGLRFEVSRPNAESNERDFLITAGGKAQLFELVEEIVKAAPELPGWKWTALHPARGFGFKMEYEGVPLDPAAMWFLPLDGQTGSPPVGIRIGIPNYSPDKEESIYAGVTIILETALGERVKARDVGQVQVSALPESPAKQGYKKLVSLARHLQQRRKE